MGERYQEYLDSKAWQEKRQFALTRAEYRCQVCNGDLRLEVHHRSYERLYEHEEISDLIVLCEWCHKLHHSNVLASLETSMKHLDSVIENASPTYSDEDFNVSPVARVRQSVVDNARAMKGLLLDHWVFFGGQIGLDDRED